MSTPRSKAKRKRRSGGSAISTPKKRGRGAGRSSNGKAKRGGSKRVLSFAMPSANVGNGDADAEDEDADADSFDGIRSRLHVYGNFGNFGMDKKKKMGRGGIFRAFPGLLSRPRAVRYSLHSARACRVLIDARNPISRPVPGLQVFGAG